MQYNGGKFRQISHICPIINSFIKDVTHYYEPFVGGLNIPTRVDACSLNPSDGNKALISMWSAAMEGFDFPEVVSESEYAEAFNLHDDNPLKAFILIGCSFGGIYKGGFARGVNGNYAAIARRGIKKKVEALSKKTVSLRHLFFNDFEASGGVIYMDPPYVSSRNYPGFPKFNHVEFWEKCRALARDNVVLVSECDVPKDCELLWQREVGRTLGDKSSPRPAAVEKLVRVYA